MSDNRQRNGFWGTLLELPDEILVIGLLAILISGSFLWGWLSELPVFENKAELTTKTVEVEVQFVLNLQTAPQAVYETITMQGELKNVRVSDWTGEVTSDDCVLSAEVYSEKADNMVGKVNSILSVASLPLEFQQKDLIFSKPVDCSETEFSHQVYIEVTGAEGSGDLLYVRKSGFDHEKAFVSLPRNLYDLVLLAAVNESQFEMPNYAQVGWYRGQELASVTYELGDPNGLNSWVQSWLPVMQYVYGTGLSTSSPQTIDVEVVVGSKKVKVDEHRECTNRYKGNCRNFEMIPDYSYVPVTEMRQVTTVTYYIP